VAPVLHILLALQASGGVKFAEPLRIDPDRPACLAAHAFPVLKSRIEPWNTVLAARLYFRSEAYPLWYSVAMQRTGEAFVALLPKPRPSAQRVVYFVEAEGLDTRARSLEHAAVVVEDPAQCGGGTAEAVDAATIAIAVPRGAPAVPPVPAGFEPVGAVAEHRAGGGGARESLIVGGAVAAAAGAVALWGGHPPRPSPPPGVRAELAVIDSVPPPESRLSLAEGALLHVRVRLRTATAVQPGQVTVVLYRAAEGIGRPCGTLAAPHDGFLLGTARELTVGGPLGQARTCEPSDRVRIVLTGLGVEALATGVPGLPDAALRYFITP
jgi:hypothetical protein